MKLVCAAVVFAAIAQAGPPRERQAITSTTTAILVDAVVREHARDLRHQARLHLPDVVVG